MKAIFFSFLLLGSIFFNVNAQPPGLKAKIVDEKGQALVGAHIVLKSLETGKENAILSNGSGEFVFQRVAPGLYSLRISYVGHENYSENISILSFPKNMGEIILKEEAKEIGEVSIVKKVPLATINEDTIEYNADAYKTTPDADAEDLVAKMPGVEISEGSVKAQGEEIEKVKVDGKPFFNNDPSLALKNLPAEIIEKIQIYEEQSEQSQFTGFDDGNTTKTMNVVTRKNMRKGQFGKFYAGYGPENYYALGGNLSDFNGDRRITILGQSNNLSNQGFSMQDILGAMGSRGSRGGGRAGGQGGMRGGSGGSPNMQNFMIGQQSGVSEISTLGINYNDSWGEKTTVSGNYFFNKVDNLTEEMTNQQYLLSGFAGQTYHESDISSKLNRNHRAFLRIDYRPDSKNRIMFRPNLSFQNNDSESKLSGETFKYLDPLNSTINDYYSQTKGYNISSDLLYMHAFEKTGRSISLNISGSLNNRDGETSLYAISDYYALESMETDSIDQISNNITEGSSISGRIMYTEPLSEFSVLQFNYDYSVRSNDADQTTFNLDPMNSVYELIDTLLSSKFLNTNYSQGIGTGYRYRKESMMFMASVNYRRTNLLSNEEFPISSEDEYDFHSILPMLMLNLELGSNRNLRFMLRTRSDVPSISQLQTVVDNSNPLQLSTGNPSLEPDVSNSFTLRYSSANIEKSSMFYAGFRANISRNEISNSSFIASGDTIINGISLANGSKLIIPVNLDGSWSMNLFSTYGIPVNPIKCNLNFTASVNLSKKPGLVNGETGHSLDRSGTVGYALVSNISSNIDFTISSNATYNNPISSFNTMLSEAYFYLFSRVKFKWILEKGWFLDTQFSHSLYNGLSEDYDQSFALWNIGAGKKIFRNQRGELSIKFYDALNQNTSISRTVSDSYISDMETNVIERYFLLSFRYDLRRMGF